MIRHEGKNYRRLEPINYNPREVAFARRWEEEAPRVLPWILCGDGTKITSDLTQEQATDVATVVQWLGSNVGFSFLIAALKRCGYAVSPEIHKSRSARFKAVQG